MRAPDVTLPLYVRLQRLFYIVSPNESSFKTLDEVPDYVNEVSLFAKETYVIHVIVSFIVAI